MSALTLQSYEQLVLRSGLVGEDRLRQSSQSLRQNANGSPPTPQRLAEILIGEGLLTKWQNDKLMAGKHQGFFLGKYKLLSHLSSGGMSSVYLAEHTLMQRKVAIKVLPPARIDDASYLPRFQRECHVMATLDHNNVVRAHDFDVDGRLHYLVLEYVDGLDLHQLVERDGPVPFDKAASYMAQAADGLQHAHDLQMVHRDMKPANLMVDQRGVVKVLDLGVARIVSGDDDAASLTLAHKEDVLGTADFLAPEQALNSHHVDHRADIYALGCTFYYILTGGVPYKEDNLAKKLMAHQTQEPAPITDDRPDCPPGLVGICRKMMFKDLDERYQTMNEVSADLRRWLRHWEAGRTDYVPTSAEDSANEPLSVAAASASPSAAAQAASAAPPRPVAPPPPPPPPVVQSPVVQSPEPVQPPPVVEASAPPAVTHAPPPAAHRTEPGPYRPSGVEADTGELAAADTQPVAASNPVPQERPPFPRPAPRGPITPNRPVATEGLPLEPIVPPGGSSTARSVPGSGSNIHRRKNADPGASEPSTGYGERSSMGGQSVSGSSSRRTSRRAAVMGSGTSKTTRPRYKGGRTASSSGQKTQMLVIALLFAATLPMVVALAMIYGERLRGNVNPPAERTTEQAVDQESPAPSGPSFN